MPMSANPNGDKITYRHYTNPVTGEVKRTPIYERDRLNEAFFLLQRQEQARKQS